MGSDIFFSEQLSFSVFIREGIVMQENPGTRCMFYAKVHVLIP